MKETTFIFCLALSLLASSAIAGDPVDYLSSEATFLEAYPEAVEIQPGVFQVAVDESRIRTYAFGRKGMEYELERTRELVLKEQQAGKSSERSELEDAYWSLSESLAKEIGGAGITGQSNDSGHMCWGHVRYELEAAAWPCIYYNSCSSAYAGIDPDIGPGPAPPNMGPFSLYAYAFADNGDTSDSDGGQIGPIPGPPASTSAYAESSGFIVECMYSTASAWVYAQDCGSPSFRSINEDFSYPSGCN